MNNNYNFKEHLFLFDIDGTILETGGSGKKAFKKALEKVLLQEVNYEINFLGGIDYVIFKNIYQYLGRESGSRNKHWEEFKKTYTDFLKEYTEHDQWNLFNNAEYSIQLLYKESNIGLVTGNIENGAKIKLNKFNLDKYFNCGGFGDYINSRAELVESAIKSSEDYYKKKFDKRNIYLFGDTLIDIQSAIDNNIIPVLIDPNQVHIKKSRNWPVKYHGSFENIEVFLQEIKMESINEELLFFC